MKDDQRRADINQALYEIMELSVKDFSLEDIMAGILDELLSLEWLALEKKGCVFLASPKEQTLHMTAQRNLNDSLLSMCSSIKYGQCLCGLAALRQELLFKSCIDGEHHNHPQGMQPHGHYNMPIVHNGETLAVINLYVKHGHIQQKDELDFLNAVAKAASAVIQRKMAEEKLKHLNEELHNKVRARTAEVESLARFPEENPNPVLRVTSDNVISYMNTAAKTCLAELGIKLSGELPAECVASCSEARELGEVIEEELHVGGRYISITCSPSTCNDGDINVYARNITGQRVAELENRKLVAVVEQAAEIIVITDTNGTIQYVNPAFERVSGYTASEAIGKNPNIVKSGRHDNAYYQSMWEALQSGNTWSGYFVNRAKDGSLYEVNQSVFPIYQDTGVCSGYAAVQHDVTELRKAERKVQHTNRLEALGVLAGGIAHDFNNILSTILGNASIARLKTPADSVVYKPLENIEQASEKAANLCKQMLAYSGKGAFVTEPVCLTKLVDEIATMLRVSLPKYVVIKLSLQDDMPKCTGDISQLQQLAMNLITNAAEAIDEGRDGLVSISTGVMEAGNHYLTSSIEGDGLQAGRYVFLEVEDDGCGMGRETIEKIFDPFFTTKFTGRGLGMSAVLGIIRGHHGCLRIRSKEECGTTIRILFPALENAVEDLPVDDDTTVEPEKMSQQGVALVIDDEETLRDVAGAMLEVFGFSILSAENGVEGIEVFQRNSQRISLVLLDMTMPKMNGICCFEKLREIRNDVKVIVVSGYSKEKISESFGQNTPAYFLQKPYSLDDLGKAIEQVRQD